MRIPSTMQQLLLWRGFLVWELKKTAYGCSFIVLKYWLVTIRELCTISSSA